jgi:hypothetical protein
MKKTIFYLSTFALLILLASCQKDEPAAFQPNEKADKELFSNEFAFTGTIKYIKLEGGFYGIISDDGKHYDPLNLPVKYQKDGLKVKVKASLADNQASFHMWGTLINIISINAFHQNFETIEIGSNSGMLKPQYVTINNQKDFENIWKQTHSIMTPVPTIPKVDFSKETVIGMFMGEFHTGGYSIKVTKVDKNKSELTVYFQTTYPKIGQIVTQALTQPYHIIKVDGVYKNVKFEFDNGVKNADIRNPEEKEIKDTY